LRAPSARLCARPVGVDRAYTAWARGLGTVVIPCHRCLNGLHHRCNRILTALSPNPPLVRRCPRASESPMAVPGPGYNMPTYFRIAVRARDVTDYLLDSWDPLKTTSA
jgi:hypothetical protein